MGSGEDSRNSCHWCAANRTASTGSAHAEKSSCFPSRCLSGCSSTRTSCCRVMTHSVVLAKYTLAVLKNQPRRLAVMTRTGPDTISYAVVDSQVPLSREDLACRQAEYDTPYKNIFGVSMGGIVKKMRGRTLDRKASRHW